MTGGHPIRARFHPEDFFTFRPVFKVIITGNHRPRLRDADEAMRRRFNLIPF
jgi:putative DNA primase/helicase